MSKRKRFEQDREEDLRDFEDLDDEAARRFKDKHSLDSDEEDENTGKYDILDEDDIEGLQATRNGIRIYQTCPCLVFIKIFFFFQ